MNTKWKTRLVAFRPVIILSLFLIFALVGGVNLLNRATAPLAERNRVYLDTSIHDTAQLLIPVGIAKAAADMIEGSTIQFEAGIVVTKGGMTVEAGDIMQPLLDCINLAWKILLTSMATVKFSSLNVQLPPSSASPGWSTVPRFIQKRSLNEP